MLIPRKNSHFFQGTNQFRFPHLDKVRYDAGQGAFAKLKGEYNTTTKTWITKRTLVYEDVAPNAALASIETGNIVVLPVDLISFTAKPQINTVNLNWSTASEEKNSHFDIMRSSDGKKFSFIAKVDGKGTSTQIEHYAYTDFKPLSGINYYQLRQTDTDGKVSFSEIRAVQMSLEDKIFSVYTSSNPTSVNFKVHTEIAHNAKIVVSNIKGEELARGVFNLLPGQNIFNLHVGLSAGVYVARLFSERGNQSAKFIKE